MALAITSITPSEGATAGKTFVTIEGIDFDIHPYPPTTLGFIGDPGPSLKVKFDHLYATNVRVQPKPGGLPGETIIECITPRYVGDPSAIPVLVDVTVENLLVPASVTATNGFKYKHQDAKPTTAQSPLLCVSYSLLKELARQIPVKDVVDRTHTDYDDVTGDALNIVEIADVPALIVNGPSLDRSDGIYRQQDREVETAPGEFKILRAPVTVDATYTLTLVDEHSGRLINLVSILTSFVDENGRLGVELVPGDPSQGFVYFDLDWIDLPEVNNQASKDNVRTATASMIVRGIPSTRVDGIQIEKTFEVEEIALDIVSS